jgi:D-arabinose 1-dehydrogenase-like Zn-dependent alcohol dehydrogenase
MSEPKSAVETVAGARGHVEEPIVRYKRVVISRLGGPEVLEVREEELPEPGLGEVRVRILATGVSYADLLMREGVHPEAPRPPFTPGWDLVGVVDKLGVGAYALEAGQMVAALPVRGANAEFICLPQEELVPVPAGLDPAEALVVVFNYVTVYQMMRRTARVKPGQRVLIHGPAPAGETGRSGNVRDGLRSQARTGLQSGRNPHRLPARRFRGRGSPPDGRWCRRRLRWHRQY